MEEQLKFLEMLREIKEIGKSQQNKMTKEEISCYLGENQLPEEKLQAVYQYLGENGIKVEGFAFIPIQAETAEKNSETSFSDEKTRKKSVTRAQKNLRSYQRELAGIVGNLEEEETLIVSYLRGEDTLKNTLIEMRLTRVVELAKKYRERPVPQEEVIAEGNVGLMAAMGIIERNREEYLRADGTLDREKFFGTLDMEVVHAMECFIDEEVSSKDWEQAVLAKTNLLHEAVKYLTEELGRMPSVEELSEYTRIEPEEIRRMTELSKDTKRQFSS